MFSGQRRVSAHICSLINSLLIAEFSQGDTPALPWEASNLVCVWRGAGGGAGSYLFFPAKICLSLQVNAFELWWTLGASFKETILNHLWTAVPKESLFSCKACVPKIVAGEAVGLASFLSRRLPGS